MFPMLIGTIAANALSKGVKDAIVRATTKVATQRHVDQNAQAIVAQVTTNLATDPKFVNATNSEKPIQSRVTLGGAQGFLGGLAILLPIVLRWLGVQVSGDYVLTVGGAILAVAGPAQVLWGRWAPGLKPLFSTPVGIISGSASVIAVVIGVVIVVLRLT